MSCRWMQPTLTMRCSSAPPRQDCQDDAWSAPRAVLRVRFECDSDSRLPGTLPGRNGGPGRGQTAPFHKGQPRRAATLAARLLLWTQPGSPARAVQRFCSGIRRRGRRECPVARKPTAPVAALEQPATDLSPPLARPRQPALEASTSRYRDRGQALARRRRRASSRRRRSASEFGAGENMNAIVRALSAGPPNWPIEASDATPSMIPRVKSGRAGLP